MRSLATLGRTSPSHAPLLINKSLECGGCKQHRVQMTDDITLSKTKLTVPHLCVVWWLQILCLEECEEGGENSRDFSSINSAHGNKAVNIHSCISHLRHGLFFLLTSGKRFHSTHCRISRFCKSFFPSGYQDAEL